MDFLKVFNSAMKINRLRFTPLFALLVLAGCGGGPVISSSSSSLNSSSLNSSSLSSSSVIASNSSLNTSSISSANSSLRTSNSSVSNSSSSAFLSSSSSAAAIGEDEALVYAINAGSDTMVTADGVIYRPDRFATGGNISTTNDVITGASNSALYQSERYGTYSYEVPVSNATYSVLLHFAELYHQTSGARTFSVAIEGKTILNNIDLYSLAGHDGAYPYVAENIPVSDGKLTISLTTTLHNATLSGLAIYSANGGKFEEPPEPVCTDAERQTPRKITVNNMQLSQPPTGTRGFAIEHANQTLPNHTVYRPQTLMSNDKLPIVAWGNGGCSNKGTDQADFISEITSHGYLVIAHGAPNGGGTNDQHETELIKAINWAIAENSRQCSQFYGKLNVDKIAAMGWSCGGGMAHYAAVDPRVDTAVALNSGIAIYADRFNYYPRFHSPLAIFNGKSSEVEYEPGLKEYSEVNNVPIYHANHASLGHGDAYFQNNGGDMGRAAVGWLNFQLKDDMTATGRGLFFGNNCFMCRAPWTSKNKGFEN